MDTGWRTGNVSRTSQTGHGLFGWTFQDKKCVDGSCKLATSAKIHLPPLCLMRHVRDRGPKYEPCLNIDLIYSALLLITSRGYVSCFFVPHFRCHAPSSGRCTSDLGRCTVHSRIASFIWPPHLAQGITHLWISAPRLQMAQTHRCTVHSSFDASSPDLSILILRPGIIPLWISSPRLNPAFQTAKRTVATIDPNILPLNLLFTYLSPL